MEHLSLASNPIGDNIEEFVFENVTTLTHLDLRNISATFFHPKLFENLKNLRYLDLSLNPIEKIPPLPSDKLEVLDLSETNLESVASLDLPNLRELYLNNMPNLTIALLNNLKKLQNLEILSMKNCKQLSQLQIWPPEPNLLPNLRLFYVQDCAIKTLSNELQPLIERTTTFEIQNNPWRCDCRMRWILMMKPTYTFIDKIK